MRHHFKRSTALAFALSILGGEAAAQQAPHPIPERWDTTYVIMVDMDPGYTAESDSAAGSVLAGHIQYQLGLLADGRASQGGPIADATPTEVIGMTILKTGSRKEAEAIAAADPGVMAGRFTARVRAWTTPARESK